MLRLLWSLPFLLTALAPGNEPVECHKNHCHGPALCGTGWKDYREQASADAPSAADDKKSACDSALALLAEQTKARATEACNKHHKCGQCPDRCSGCELQRPTGRLGDEAKRKLAATQGSDGKWQCKAEAEVVFRCRCTFCKVKAAAPAE